MKIKLYDYQRIAIINGLLNLCVDKRILNKPELINIIKKTTHLEVEE